MFDTIAKCYVRTQQEESTVQVFSHYSGLEIDECQSVLIAEWTFRYADRCSSERLFDAKSSSIREQNLVTKTKFDTDLYIVRIFWSRLGLGDVCWWYVCSLCWLYFENLADENHASMMLTTTRYWVQIAEFVWLTFYHFHNIAHWCRCQIRQFIEEIESFPQHYVGHLRLRLRSNIVLSGFILLIRKLLKSGQYQQTFCLQIKLIWT